MLLPSPFAEIGKDKCDEAALSESDPMAKAGHVIRNAKGLDVECFIQPENIVKNNTRKLALSDFYALFLSLFLSLLFPLLLVLHSPLLHSSPSQA